jgi:hypothetical protein
MHVQHIIARLGLEKHPEGGYYRETYRSEESLSAETLPERFAGGTRSFSTSIYFLLAKDDVSALHRIKSDEVWYFHSGDVLEIHVLDQCGRYTCHKLGGTCADDVSFQVVVKAGCWFGASLENSDSYALVGCSVSPGFDFRDFELADKMDLLRVFPDKREIIERLTR